MIPSDLNSLVLIGMVLVVFWELIYRSVYMVKSNGYCELELTNYLSKLQTWINSSERLWLILGSIYGS